MWVRVPPCSNFFSAKIRCQEQIKICSYYIITLNPPFYTFGNKGIDLGKVVGTLTPPSPLQALLCIYI